MGQGLGSGRGALGGLGADTASTGLDNLTGEAQKKKEGASYNALPGMARLLGGGTAAVGGYGIYAIGKGIDLTGQGLGAIGSVLSKMDMNDLSLKGLINALDPNSKPVFDGPGLKRGARMVRCNIDKGVSTGEDLIQLVIGWTKFFLQIVAALAVIALIYAGFTYVTSFGNDSRMESAKKAILFTALGILLILGAYAIVNTLMQVRFGVLI